MGIHGLSKLISDVAPHAVKEKKLDTYFGRKVAIDASKPEIKEAVEAIFKVVVSDLQVLNVKGKTKRSARGRLRRKSDWKKAYVRLEAGHEIDFADIG